MSVIYWIKLKCRKQLLLYFACLLFYVLATFLTKKASFSVSLRVALSHSLSYSHHHHTIFSLFTLFFSLLSSYSHIRIQKIQTLQSNAPQHPAKISLYFPFSVDLNHPGSQKNRILISGSCRLLHLGTPKRIFLLPGFWLLGEEDGVQWQQSQVIVVVFGEFQEGSI